MITMDMLGKVRRMKMRDKRSISQIAKRTGLARNTIRGWLRAPGDGVPKYERRPDVHKPSAFEESLVMALKANRLRSKDARRTARALFVQIRAQGYRPNEARSTISMGKRKILVKQVDGCVGKPRIIWDIRDTRWNVKVPSRRE